MSETGQPGRYQRSANGLFVALVVSVALVVGVVVVRSLFSNELKVEPEKIDYLETIEAAQQAKLRPVYPGSLPKGWIVTGVDVVPGEDPAFGLKILTDAEQFIGIRQEDASLTSLLATYVDEDEVSDEKSFRAADAVAPSWQGYADSGGDHALAAEVGGEQVLVYGSAPVEDLQELVELLTQDRLGQKR